MIRRHPVVTGTGIVCAAGDGVPAVWESIRANRSGLGPLTLFPSARYANHLVGQVRADVDARAGRVRGSRSDKLAWIAAREALAAAGLENMDPARTGVLLGATVGGMAATEEVLAALLRDNRRAFGPLRFHECAGAAVLCAKKIGARGPVATFSTACSAGAMAILAAAEFIEQGEADVMLVGAADSLARFTLNGFGSLLLLDPNGCRPFDARRAGISLGEGAAMLVLEAEETAMARGAKVLARLSGWGASCDAFHATAPQPEGLGAFAAMSRALERGDLGPGEIDFVSAHGTATPDNDAMEARALKKLFGDRVPPFGSVKRFFGHTLAASGAIKAVLAVQSLREQATPGTPGFEVADEKIGLQPVREFRPQPLGHVLSNSFGFGGNNVALVFSDSRRRRGEEAHSESRSRRHCFAPARADSNRFAILGAGVVSPAGNSIEEVAATFGAGGARVSAFSVPVASPATTTRVCACGEFGAEQFIEPAKRRRLSRLQQLTLVAARRSLAPELLAGVAPERICVAIGTGLGALADTAAFLENMILKDERAPRPAAFTGSVHNSLASQVAIEMNLAGPNFTPVPRGIPFETALWQATTEIGAGRADLALVGAADELNQYQLAAGMRWGWWDEASPEIRPLPGEGGAVFTLGPIENKSAPLASVSAIRIGRGENVEAEAQAEWICETLARAGIAAGEVDALLTGTIGLRATDEYCRVLGAALSRRAGREVLRLDYQRCCGEHHSASAFGFLTAIGLVRGEIPVEPACRTVAIFTLTTDGTRGMCCVRA
ncbi:MAG TPA: beta-ketoacyl-[acyl-carrier-protein] synthase family protein [Verrucomicrobiae bacterium]|nr:beta-ketoacyl-[acyl-carrier-protein] synthase family protein [Verrucomicrobiae bacterium]